MKTKASRVSVRRLLASAAVAAAVTVPLVAGSGIAAASPTHPAQPHPTVPNASEVRGFGGFGGHFGGFGGFGRFGGFGHPHFGPGFGFHPRDWGLPFAGDFAIDPDDVLDFLSNLISLSA